jgi:hypothetical protein
MNIRIKNKDHKQLAVLVYVKAIAAEIEERVSNKYLARIDYLVAANNELMYELEQCELEKIGNVSIPYSVADSILIEENINENK